MESQIVHEILAQESLHGCNIVRASLEDIGTCRKALGTGENG